MSWYLVTQSISRAIRSRLPVSIADSARSHMSRTLLLAGSAPLRSTKSLARFRYSYWISSALSSRPLASRTRLRPVMSWLTSRIARMALSRVRSRMIAPASIIRSTRSVEPTLSSVVVSLMLESPTITCSRRNRSASACGSSRVLMIGRDRVVAEDTPSQMCSARWLTQYTAPRGVCSTFPAPQITCRVTRNGIRISAFPPHPPAPVHPQPLEDRLSRLVVPHQVEDVVALGGGVLGMAAHVEVKPCAVAQEHVAAAAPGDHTAEEVPGYLVRGQPTAAAEGAGDPVLVLKPEDSSVHGRSPDPTARPREPAPGGVALGACRRARPGLHAWRHQSTAMYLVSVNSSKPSWPPSRPIPDCLTPPNGAAGSETTPRLMPIIPASRASATRSERRRSRVYT